MSIKVHSKFLKIMGIAFILSRYYLKGQTNPREDSNASTGHTLEVDIFSLTGSLV